MIELFISILPVFLVVAFGYICVYQRLFPDDAVEGLMLFAQNFAMPALLFRAMQDLDISTLTLNLFLGYYGGATIAFLAAMLGARHFFDRPWEDSIIIGFCALFANGLLLGVPVTQQAFGAEATTDNFSIISVNLLYCYTLGISLMEIARARRTGASLVSLPGKALGAFARNYMVIGIVLGLAVNLSGIPFPQPMTEALELLARAALPAALFGLGGVLYKYRPEGDLRTIAWIVFASLVVHPAATWIIGVSVDLPQDGFRSSVIMAAMAPGVNTYIFANLYGVAKRVVASAVLIGTAVSLVSSWLWIVLLH